LVVGAIPSHASWGNPAKDKYKYLFTGPLI
jgi:hypothetical protein